MTEPEYMDGTATGTLAPGVQQPVTIRVLWDAEGVGRTDDEALLATLQSIGIVSDDVRDVYTDGNTELGGDTLLHVIDIDTDNTVAWVRIPWTRNGSEGALAKLMLDEGANQ